MHQKFIGIDLGTTFLKGAVLDLDDVTLAPGLAKRVPFPGFITGLPASHREVSPDAIMNAVRELIAHLLHECGECSGIVLCTQMHGLVLCDAHGNAHSNAITWQDHRLLDPVIPGGETTYERPQTEQPQGIAPTQPVTAGGETTYERMMALVTAQDRLDLGNDLLPGRPLGLLYWLQQHCSESIWDCSESIWKGAGLNASHSLYPCSLPDFVISNLCHSEPCTDVTNAAAHGALNLKTAAWHHDLIGRLNLPPLTWPRIVPHGAIAGYLDTARSLSGAERQHIPCYVPIGDHQCALLGSLLRDDELSINASTGSQVGLLTSTPEVSLNYQTRPYFDGRYLKAVIHIPAGRALAALVRVLSELAEAQGVTLTDPWDYIERVTAAHQSIARNSFGTNLRVNLAFYDSSCGDRGAIENIREENLTIADLFTAAFENMADNYAECVRRITPDRNWHRTVFAGGLLQKLSGLRRATLERFPEEHRFAPTSEDTVLGLTVMALLCSGRARSIAGATDIAADLWLR